MNVRPRLANSSVIFSEQRPILTYMLALTILSTLVQGHTRFISSGVDPAVDGQCTQCESAQALPYSEFTYTKFRYDSGFPYARPPTGTHV